MHKIYKIYNFFDILYFFLFFLAKYHSVVSNIILLFTHNIKFKYPNSSTIRSIFTNTNYVELELEYKNNVWNGTQKDNLKRSFGEYSLNFKKHGYFIIFYDNGNIWKGFFENGLEHGDFTCEFKNGNIVSGTFIHGKRYGSWNILKPNGDIIYYSYHNDIKNPIHTITYTNGNAFEGIYKNDKKNGLGIMRYKNGNIFIGNYENGVRSGNGSIKFTDSNFMDCSYKNNLLDGKCTLYFKSGDILKANYIQNIINNPCELIYSNGNRFIGEFDNNFKKNGFGIYYDKRSNKSFLQRYNSYGENIKSEFWFHGDHTNFIINVDVRIKNRLTEEEKEMIYCPIKMDIMYEPVILNCNHKYCLYFLNSWRKHCDVNNFCCPLCKRKILSYSTDTKADKILEKCKFENNGNKMSLRDIRRYYDFI
jgi:antitoxin component YwqK of YwqJK toxin-antitoxin module